MAFNELVVLELHKSIAFEKLLFFDRPPALKMMAGGFTALLAFPTPLGLFCASSSIELFFERLACFPPEPCESIPRLALSRETVSAAPLPWLPRVLPVG